MWYHWILHGRMNGSRTVEINVLPAPLTDTLPAPLAIQIVNEKHKGSWKVVILSHTRLFIQCDIIQSFLREWINQEMWKQMHFLHLLLTHFPNFLQCRLYARSTNEAGRLSFYHMHDCSFNVISFSPSWENEWIKNCGNKCTSYTSYWHTSQTFYNADCVRGAQMKLEGCHSITTSLLPPRQISFLNWESLQRPHNITILLMYKMKNMTSHPLSHTCATLHYLHLFKEKAFHTISCVFLEDDLPGRPW